MVEVDTSSSVVVLTICVVGSGVVFIVVMVVADGLAEDTVVEFFHSAVLIVVVAVYAVDSPVLVDGTEVVVVLVVPISVADAVDVIDTGAKVVLDEDEAKLSVPTAEFTLLSCPVEPNIAPCDARMPTVSAATKSIPPSAMTPRYKVLPPHLCPFDAQSLFPPVRSVTTGAPISISARLSSSVSSPSLSVGELFVLASDSAKLSPLLPDRADRMDRMDSPIDHKDMDAIDRGDGMLSPADSKSYSACIPDSAGAASVRRPLLLQLLEPGDPGLYGSRERIASPF